MNPNPYEPPREYGYIRPPPPHIPLWRRLVRGVILAILFVGLGWLLLFLGAVALDYINRWQIFGGPGPQ
jgi:hypothetical protein